MEISSNYQELTWWLVYLLDSSSTSSDRKLSASNPFPVWSNPSVRRDRLDRRCGWHVQNPIFPLLLKSVPESRSEWILDDGARRGKRSDDLEIH